MAAIPETTTSPTSPIQPPSRIPVTSDREPTLPDAATSSQPSLQGRRDGTPSGWITTSPLKTGQCMLEIMGYRARRDLPIRTWAVGRFIFSAMLALLQIVAIVIVTCLAFVHGEYDLCHWPTVSNIIWGGKLLLFQCYPDCWFLYKRLKMRREPVQGTPIIQVCPPDHATFMNLVTFLEVLPVSIWILIQVAVLVVHGKQCYVHAPHVSTLAFIILVLALLYYLPTTWLVAVRRSREPRSDGGDDIEIGPLPQSKVDRIDLVYYIPHPPLPPAASSRPSGPVAGSRHFGRASKPRVTDGDAKQRPRGNGEWENTFQRMPHDLLRIEDHEAQCAICLEDYTEPPRAIPGSASASAMQSAIAYAQEAPEPLRWLRCGHVFHKRCIDQSITQGPAKCPTCRTPVKVRRRTPGARK